MLLQKEKMHWALNCSQIFMLYMLKYITSHIKFYWNLWVISVRHLNTGVMFSTWVNRWISFSLLMLHWSRHGKPWKSEGNYLGICGFFLWFELQKAISLGQYTPFYTCFIECAGTWNRIAAAYIIVFSFPTIRLNFILLSSTLRCTGCHVQYSPIILAFVLPLPVKTYTFHPSAVLNMAVIPMPCARSYFTLQKGLTFTWFKQQTIPQRCPRLFCN